MMGKRILIIVLSVILCLGCCFMGCSNSDKINGITIDFSAKTGTEIQNIKKIDMFSPTWEFCGTGAGMVNYESIEQFDFLDDLQAEKFRIDFMMGNGGIGSLIGKNSNGTTDKEFSSIMEISSALAKNNVSPMYVLCNIPEYAQIDGLEKNMPDADKWYEICYNIATYLKNNNVNNITYETWNEPDLGNTFWGGSISEMTDLSILTTKAVRDADNYATVSALGLCWPLDFINKKATEEDGTLTHWSRFWKRSLEQGAIPDAFSWHYYGQPDGMMEDNMDVTDDFSYWLSTMRNAFNETQNGTNTELGMAVDLSTVQQLLTEYHAASSLDSKEDTVGNISKMYDSIGYALNATDITKVYWACYVSSLFGVIDKYNYMKNAGYNVLWSYARLPVDRIECDLQDDEFGYYCGADSSRAGLIIYNKSEKEKSVKLNLANIPFNADNMTVYKIDNKHLLQNTSIATPYIMQQKTKIAEADLSGIELSLEGNTGYYIEVNDMGGKSEIEQSRSIGTILKKEYYYYERGDKKPYADLHNNSLTAIVGMGNGMNGKSAVSAIIDTKKTVDGFNVKFSNTGKFVKTAESTLGIKVDYQTKSGYSDSVLYSVGGCGYDFVLPFGGKSLSSKIINMSDKYNGSYQIDLKGNAPEDWTGIINITYIIKDMGYGATEKFIIER
jgi:hypothetical protein